MEAGLPGRHNPGSPAAAAFELWAVLGLFWREEKNKHFLI